MNDRPTPETDALWHSLNTGKNQPSWWVVAEKMRDLASRLEARARFFEHGFHTHSAGAHQYMIERDEARRERDEAREALDCLLAVIGLTPIAGNKHALQEAVDHGLVVLRKQQEAGE